MKPVWRLTRETKREELAAADPVPQGNQIRNDGAHAVIINEYGWHWVNRDGTPTTLTRDIYRSVLGENATPAQRFHMQATWLAADTEFWRMHRKAAAVVHFTMLGYARPDGQTCDHWRQGGVEKLAWEPEFYRYVRDAFAPVGLGISFWKDRVLSQSKSRVPVMLVNDLDQAWKGPPARGRRARSWAASAPRCRSCATRGPRAQSPFSRGRLRLHRLAVHFHGWRVAPARQAQDLSAVTTA